MVTTLTFLESWVPMSIISENFQQKKLGYHPYFWNVTLTAPHSNSNQSHSKGT